MFNLVTAAVGGHMAAKMEPTNVSTSVMSSFEESRVVSTVLELVATLFDNTVSSLPVPISYTITYLPMVLFGIGRSGQIKKNSEAEKAFQFIHREYKQLIKTTVFSMAFFGVLFGKHVRMTSIVTLVTFTFFSLVGTTEGKKIIKRTGLEDKYIVKIESVGALVASIGIVFANSSWIFKVHGALRAFQHFDVVSGEFISTKRGEIVEWAREGVEKLTGHDIEWLINRAATLREYLTSH